MKRYAVLLAAVVAAFAMWAQKSEYTPVIGGVMRVRAEALTDSESGLRMAVRNARVYLRGQMPVPVSYFLQADLCNQGRFQFLDAWLQARLSSRFDVRAGQFRVPFGVDTFRGPGNYVFANRSFIGRDMLNRRAVGLQGAWHTSTAGGTSLGVTGGVFSPSAITDHTDWSWRLSYALKGMLTAAGFTLSPSFASDAYAPVRVNLYDLALGYRTGGLTVEAEWVRRQFTHHAFRGCNAYNVWADYGWPLARCWFKTVSVQSRFDLSEANSTATEVTDGHCLESTPLRRRLTVGSTLAAPFAGRGRLALRLNYEKYFYPAGYRAPDTRRDVIVAELIGSF